MADLTPRQIAHATGCDLEDIEVAWPMVMYVLDDAGIGSIMTQIAAAATMAVECKFRPICERMANPKRQPRLAKIQAAYAPYFGRGYIMLTWRRNYEAAGAALGIDLVGNPDKALHPGTAAKILAWFFKVNNVDDAAEARDPLKVRIRVNGINKATGLPNGWDEFKSCWDRLLKEVEG